MTPTKKKLHIYAEGYQDGKRRGRIEVLIVLAVLYFGIALIGRFSAA